MIEDDIVRGTDEIDEIESKSCVTGYSALHAKIKHVLWHFIKPN